MVSKNYNKKVKSKATRQVGRPVEGSTVNAKDQILQSYFKICQLEGIENMTLQKIADHSGVALTTVRYHFQTHGLSLSQVAMSYVSNTTYEFLDLGMLLARREPNFNPVISYIQTTFRWIEEQPLQASFLVYYYYLCTTQVALGIENKELVEIAHRRIQGLIHEGLGMKLYTYSGDTMLLSRQIQMLVMGACMIAGTSRNVEFASAQKKLCIDLVAKFLGTNNLDTD